MKTVNLSLERPTRLELLELASQENVILKTREGREFILAETDDFGAEAELVRQNDELMQLLAQRSREAETYSLSQVRQMLSLQ